MDIKKELAQLIREMYMTRSVVNANPAFIVNTPFSDWISRLESIYKEYEKTQATSSDESMIDTNGH